MDEMKTESELLALLQTFGLPRGPFTESLCRRLIEESRASKGSALAHAEQRIAEWLGATLGLKGPPHEVLVAGRAAFCASRLGQTSPELFLNPSPDAAALERLRRFCPMSVPEPHWGQMAQQSLSPAPLWEAVRRFLISREVESQGGPSSAP